MTKKLNIDDLLAMYDANPNAKEIASQLRANGIDVSDRTIQRRIQYARQKPTRTARNPKGVLQSELPTTDPLPVARGSVYAPHKTRPQLSGNRFVFTSAQNNTYVHKEFLQSLQRFCKLNDAELIVSRFLYNKSGFQNGEGADDVWYDPAIREFIRDESLQVADDLVFCGELNILPTATNPLSGFENYCASSSAIIPHAKLAMKSMPRMKHEDPRFLYTTGAVTLRNYIAQKAGQKAEFHHVFGALYVEIDADGDWFVRQLIADADGFFQDLTTVYTPSGIVTDVSVEAINWGDIHVENINLDVMECAFGDSGMLRTLNPAYQFIHDLTDFSARNHHNIKDPYFLAEKYHRGEDSVRDAIVSSAAFLEAISATGTQTVVVESNHDLAFRKWLREADIRSDPQNAEYFHVNNAAIHRAIRNDVSDFSIFEYAIRKVTHLDNVTFLREDESFVICNDTEAEGEGRIIGGIECGMHGHLGPNGARGSGANLRHIGRKANIGHVHSAGIIDGVYMAGVTCELDMGYNKGPSSWSHSHIITYPNGKRTIVTIKRGKWRA